MCVWGAGKHAGVGTQVKVGCAARLGRTKESKVGSAMPNLAHRGPLPDGQTASGQDSCHSDRQSFLHGLALRSLSHSWGTGLGFIFGWHRVVLAQCLALHLQHTPSRLEPPFPCLNNKKETLQGPQEGPGGNDPGLGQGWGPATLCWCGSVFPIRGPRVSTVRAEAW